MRRNLIATSAVLSLLVCVVTITLWGRSRRITDCKAFTTEVAGHRRYWKLVSYHGGFGTKVTDDWPMWDRTYIYSQPTDVPQWTFFPGGITTDLSVLGFRILRGTDRFNYFDGTHDVIRPGLVLLLPYWLIVLATAFPSLWFAAGAARHARRVRSGCRPTCGYDLRGSPGRCSECGAAAPSRTPVAA